MRLISVTLRNCRLHRELKVDFDPASTLIGGPNETGKSTLIEGVHRALFLKAKGSTEHHRALNSTLHPGHPEVELTFEAAGQTYVLKKRFGNLGTTTLAPSHAVALTGDAAESELARLLSVEAGGTGKAVTVQWAHLWVWQGQAGEDPSTHATAQQAGLLQRLQQMGGAAVLQSELDVRVAKHFAEANDQIFTQAGKPKKGSELEKAESAATLAGEELARATDRVQKLESAATDLENALQTLYTANASVVGLEKEQEAVKIKTDKLVELQRMEVEQSHSAKKALDSYAPLEAANEQIFKTRFDISELEKSLKPQNETVTRSEKARDEARSQAISAEQVYRAATTTVRNARRRHELATAHTQLFEKSEAYTQLTEKGGKVSQRRLDLAKLEEQLAKLPNVDMAKLQKLQRLETECSNARAALQAMATGFEVVAADQSVKAEGRPIVIGEKLILTEDTEVSIGSAVRLLIRPGGGTSLADARQTQTDARNGLQEVLDSAGIKSIQEAERVCADRGDLGSHIKAAQAKLEGMGAENLAEELQNAQNDLTTATADVDRLVTLVPDWEIPEDKATAKAITKSLKSKLGDAENQEAEEKMNQDHSTKTLETAEETLKADRIEIEQQGKQLTGLKAQLELLLTTHGDDTARANNLIYWNSAKTNTKNFLKKTTDAIADLQPNLLEGDRTRIARAIEAKTSERAKARELIAVAKATLRSDGSEDPQAARDIAKGKERSAEKHRDSVLRMAKAVALLNKMFQEEQGTLSELFTQPLADKVSGYLQCIFGAGTRAQVNLENNEFSGLTLSRPGFGNAPFAFDTLSGGAKEQTAAAVRLAMAEVLAADHDGCLPIVFDDAFTYSDPERVNKVQRMLDLAVTRGLQIIVLSCNPVDYSDFRGRSINLSIRLTPAVVPVTMEAQRTVEADETGDLKDDVPPPVPEQKTIRRPPFLD